MFNNLFYFFDYTAEPSAASQIPNYGLDLRNSELGVPVESHTNQLNHLMNSVVLCNVHSRTAQYLSR